MHAMGYAWNQRMAGAIVRRLERDGWTLERDDVTGVGARLLLRRDSAELLVIAKPIHSKVVPDATMGEVIVAQMARYTTRQLGVRHITDAVEFGTATADAIIQRFTSAQIIRDHVSSGSG